MVDIYTKGSLDPQKRAANDLELVIEEERTEEVPPEALVSYEEAETAERIATAPERTAARLLIYTTNTTALNPASELSERLFDVATLFAEVHVVVLTKTIEGAHESIRPADNLWVYPTNSRHGLDSIGDAKRIAAEQLEFAGGFRADIVVALDAFEAGVAAAQVAKKYQRPLQVHITNDIFDASYVKNLKSSFFKKLCRWYVFSQAPSVRAATRAIAKSILAHHPKLEATMEVVPQHIDLRHITEVKPAGVLSERFPQYNFFALFVGPLTDKSGALEALSAATGLLQYPTIALLYVGEGDVKKEIAQRAEAMGVQERVIISPPGIDRITALKEANLLIYPEGPDADERVLLEAAAANLPIVAGYSDFVNELFVDGESAFVCPTGDVVCMQDRVNLLLNDNTTRKQLARVAREDVLERVEQDVDEYRVAFKESVERVLYAFETPPEGEGVTQTEEVQERSA